MFIEKDAIPQMKNNSINNYTMKNPFKEIRKVIKDIKTQAKETKKIVKKSKAEQRETNKAIQIIKFESIDTKNKYDDDKRKIIKAFSNGHLSKTLTQRILNLASSDRKNSDVKYKILFDKIKPKFSKSNYLINNVIVITNQEGNNRKKVTGAIKGYQAGIITLNAKTYEHIINKLRGKIAVSFDDVKRKDRKANILYPSAKLKQEIIKMLLSDADANVIHFIDYISGFILTPQSIKQITEATNYEPMNEGLRDAQKLSTFNKYLIMEIEQHGNENYDRLDIYKCNECWLNVLYENYSDTLLRQDKNKI